MSKERTIMRIHKPLSSQNSNPKGTDLHINAQQITSKGTASYLPEISMKDSIQDQDRNKHIYLFGNSKKFLTMISSLRQTNNYRNTKDSILNLSNQNTTYTLKKAKGKLVTGAACRNAVAKFDSSSFGQEIKNALRIINLKQLDNNSHKIHSKRNTTQRIKFKPSYDFTNKCHNDSIPIKTKPNNVLSTLRNQFDIIMKRNRLLVNEVAAADLHVDNKCVKTDGFFVTSRIKIDPTILSSRPSLSNLWNNRKSCYLPKTVNNPKQGNRVSIGINTDDNDSNVYSNIISKPHSMLTKHMVTQSQANIPCMHSDISPWNYDIAEFNE